MPFTVIVDQSRVEELQRRFEERMNSMVERSGDVHVGYKGEIVRKTASWSSRLGIWWSLSERLENRFWNLFGTQEPRWNTRYSHNIVCEINIPLRGLQRNVSGAFAEDDRQRVRLVHRGRIGGGRPGIGKRAFWENFQGRQVEDTYGDRLALIGALDDERFPYAVADFVREVQHIKDTVVGVL